MSEVKVERRDRELAMKAYWGELLAARLADQTPWLDWLARGSVLQVTDAHLACVRIADGYAAVRSRGYAKCRADVAAWLRFDMSMDLTADDVEAGAHEGAADRYADETAALHAEEDDDIGASDSVSRGRKGE